MSLEILGKLERIDGQFIVNGQNKTENQSGKVNFHSNIDPNSPKPEYISWLEEKTEQGQLVSVRFSSSDNYPHGIVISIFNSEGKISDSKFFEIQGRVTTI